MSAAAAAERVIPEEGAPAPKSGKKKLILIGVVALLVLAIAGAGVLWFLKARAARAAEAAGEEDGGGKAQATAKIDRAHPPTFLPLDPFVVNLSDRDADRYAQIGITLELESPAFAEQMKSYMPAVRNAILMIVAHKSARELLDRSGKEDLADEIMREAVRPMGIEVDPPLPITVAVATRKVEAAPAASAAASSVPSASSAAPAASASASMPVVAAASAAASAAHHVAAASAPHGVTAGSAPTTVAAASAARADKPRRHGDAPKSPIHHVHFSSFIIQ